jgi:DUF4097 and DUF4098 domain-containing protein YvlB
VKTFDAEVSIDKMAGPVRIQGERLRLTLKQIEGEVGIYTSASLVQLDGATGDVSIENQDGDVLARKVNGRLEVNGRGGSVRLLELGSAVSADVESQTLEVGWATLQGGQDSILRNGSGGATVRLPPNAKCRIEAETKTGRIQSAVASVRVSDDGKAAAGSLGDAQAPVIRIEADGNIALDAVKAPPPVPPARPVRRP